MSSPATIPNSPLQPVRFSDSDFEHPAQLVAKLNKLSRDYAQILNFTRGFAGPVSFNSHLDLQGNRIMNVGAPVESSDAIAQTYGESNYGAAAIAPQIQALGKSVLQSYRRISDRVQRESYSSFLNKVNNTAPTTNTSLVTFGAPSGGFVPTTISAGLHQRVDGSQVPYAAFNDSLPQPATFTVNTLTRTGGVVSGSTTGANPFVAGQTIYITGQPDITFQGYFVLTSAVSPNFTYNQIAPNASTTGGTAGLGNIYYYSIHDGSNILFRTGPFTSDSPTNRLAANFDGSVLIAVSTLVGTGGDPTNSAAGATPPAQNTGANPRLIQRL